ncbi:Putative beta-barrel porin-2, OmpL-like. bbp2 [Methylobacterium phyllostachyos]|uniref:Putative beta-barrel porin-2, OmpL-like. bbp2 n=1 Tax=Methylobacterium phyllostachyos TaxID=582672 RepID=A0A1H0GE97_9HYPH|nr:porin [Methylobacterium phyllostachyos]SDO05203.1 Putative beta-barrel porin-2, OmpL-like. bbp2 [Methylobacterium phyllostachyos]
MLTRSTLAGFTAVLLSSTSILAADLAAPAPVPVAPPVEPCKATLLGPTYSGVIKANPNPTCFSAGPLGDLYVGGAVTGYAYTQTNPFASFSTPAAPNDRDRAARVDFSNLQGIIQKPEGAFQFYVQAGAYSIPQLGFPTLGTFTQTDLLFGPVPVAYGKFQINDEWSIQGGRMFTLIGTEPLFTYQNLNINRGLLFVQENFINQGVQVNYASGPLSVSLAGTDGFFSNEITWFTGNVAYKLDDFNTIGVNGGLNLGRTNALARSSRYQFATPYLQQNSGIFDINYTYANGPWIVSPYFQFTNVERDPRIGIYNSASTYGGALLAAYSFTDNFSLAGRIEYTEQTGVRGSGTTNLLGFGAGSNAFSVTVTPTFTFDRYFFRVEYAHVELGGITRASISDTGLLTPGTGFGRTGNRTSQDRYMVETGITF